MKRLPLAAGGFILPVMLLLLTSLWSCQGNAGADATGQEEQEATTAFITPVETMVMEPTTFLQELHSNGRLYARRKSRLSYPFGEELVKVEVVNGQRVQAGQQLALLCRDNITRQLEQAQIRMARAALEMEDILLGRGHTMKDSLQVDPAIWQMAGIQSGYLEAAREVKTLLTSLEKTSLKAPYSGVVAGVTARMYEKVGAGEVFCTLIDDSAFLVEFPVMENELSMLKEGARVEVQPFSDPSGASQGRVSSIDPVVDDHGQVMVTALVTHTKGLMDGMNVKVRVIRQVPRQLVVPKAAVLYRDNLEVLFKYTGGKAEWTYVNIVQQNGTHYSVIANPDRVASLQAGDTVIVANNLNLAHGAKVEIVSP